MRNPENLEVVEVAAELAVVTYRVTRAFPTDERFGLTSQMRRAAVSVGSNIVEGCSRRSDAAFLNFLEVGLGSCMELDYQAMLGGRLGIGRPDSIAELRAEALRAKQMLHRLISVVAKKHG